MSSSSSLSCRPVAGVWSRIFEEDPLGDEANADKTTLVYWTQVPCGIYVDMRLPIGSPGRSDTVCSRTPSPSALRATTGSMDTKSEGLVSSFTVQKSFAGVLSYKDGDTSDQPGLALEKDKILADLCKNHEASLPLCTCFWRRDIDYQPPSGGLDVGICASYSPLGSDGAIDLRETGDDGSYAEGWHRIGNTHDGPFLALELMSENGHPRTGFWVRTGPRFAYAVGRPSSAENAQALGCLSKSATVKEKVGKKLAQALEAMEFSNEEEKLNVIGSYVAVAGEISSDSGTWMILNSTNPGLVGCHLVGEDMEGDKNACSVLKSASKDVKQGDTVEQIVRGGGSFIRTWKVVELSGCSLPFL